ncbi:MAG TPA: hypothetical protein PL123_03600 [Bacteroidales bacterium]|nr:hypothetical protein [Bacteroidales bacterium]
MIRHCTILLFLSLLVPGLLYSQGRSAFSGEPDKYRTELIAFMGPNLKPEQLAEMNNFLAKWDSAAFSKESMVKIIDVSSQMSSRFMRPVPHFIDFLNTLVAFKELNKDEAFFNAWITGLSEISFMPRFTNDNLHRYFRNTGLMIRQNVLYESGSVKWKVKNSQINFLHDTVYHATVTNATLTCYSQKDSTEIYNVNGEYYPDIQVFIGTKGIVSWEKAGYSRNDVFAQLDSFSINITRNNFTFDSVKFTHTNYFREPVLGSLTDRAASFSSPEKANYPQFTTYAKEFQIKDLYKGVNYQGGLAFEGANVKGNGDKLSPARITLYRNDTLYLKIAAREFIFSKTGLNSQETAMTMYLEKDSIYHSNLGFSYFASSRQVNLFRTNNPISKSPYFNSFHRMDMYFEYLTWNMEESKILLSRSRGASLGEALFESVSFFDNDDFFRLMGLDQYHPLNRLLKFAEWYYSETFPITEFARWLNKPEETVTGMCIDLANKGFLFYDRANNEVTIKQKTKDYLQSFAKRTDYDVMRIYSSTRAPVDNAILDLRNYQLTVNGVTGVMLSDSQKVALYPYNKQLVIEKNRSLKFDGIVDAGLFTIYGKNFNFSYDTFKIRLQKIDSIRISVETDKKDMYGNPVVERINNLIELGTAELFIDNPMNKSGLRSYKQYPIINAITFSYIFYDKIPGLEGVYPQKDFYFKVDPFTYENIDHYTYEDLNLSGEFFGGKILEPMKQYLTIQDSNSLGFNMIIPDDGIGLYGNKGRLYDKISMSNRGLIGGGKLKRITSTTVAEEYHFFPDSMITRAETFNIEKDPQGVFPVLKSEDVAVKWLSDADEWIAENAQDKRFQMFDNGTTLDGSVKLTPSRLMASGAIDMTESRITSNSFNFRSNAIRADTSDYNLKSRSGDGYSFIAENANTDINFDLQESRFRLNTDSSMVKFPELQYICTMTDFMYDMKGRILNMEQKGKSNTSLMTADQLIRLPFTGLDKPTFFATNNLEDTVSFSSWKGRYNLDKEFIEAENINYIHIADALIKPDSGKVTITRRAKVETMNNALIAVNNKHILHSASVDIESTKRYTGSAVYDYIDENKEIQEIKFPELSVDTMTTTAKGYIPGNQKFRLSPDFTYSGDVLLSARSQLLTFTGAAGIIHKCSQLTSYDMKFKSAIDPLRVMIPVSDKPRDINDNLVFSGSFINADSVHIYPAFLSAQKSWTDVALVNANGYLWFDKAKGSYLISSLEKISDPTLNGNLVSFDRNYCVMAGEGNLNFGTKYDLFTLSGAGNYTHTMDSGKVVLETILGMDFHFSPEGLKMMADEIRMMPTLQPVNLNTPVYLKGMKDLVGVQAANQLKEEIDLFGTSRNLPKEFTYELLLNDVKLYWNEATASFRSKGRIGIGFIGPQPVNIYTDGYVEIQRRRSGDMLDIYLKADNNTWYYFSYFRGVLMTQSSNSAYNTLITNIKINDRKHPDASVRVPYTYMIAAEGRLNNFLRRMTSDESAEEDVIR